MIAADDLMRYYFNIREQFTLPEDVYAGWVILAVQSGRFTFVVETDPPLQGEAGFGELVVCPPGVKLRRTALGPVSFHFTEFSSLREWPAGKIGIRDVTRLSSTFDYLRRWHERRIDAAKDEAAHLVGDLLLLVHREQLAQSKRRQAAPQDPLMLRAAAEIKQRACEPEFSLQALAATLGMSASQLTRRFQAVHGVSPVQYATKVRLGEAMKLLTETDWTLEAIAASCGYENGFYLSRVFSRHMQISPSAYRRAYRV